MNPQWLFAGLLMSTLVAQALLPAHRLLVVLAGAALSCAGAAFTGRGLAEHDRDEARPPANPAGAIVGL